MDVKRRKSLSAFDQTVEVFGSSAAFVFFRYSTRCDRLDSREDVSGPEDLWALQDRDLRFQSKESGSRLDLALGMACETAESAHVPLDIVLIGDGENTGGPLAPLINRLAKCPNVRSVVFIGLTPLFQQQRIRDFAPFGVRFHPATYDSAGEALHVARTQLLAQPTPAPTDLSASHGKTPR